MTKIQWTNKTWNPIVGCSKVSAGCKNCYAIRMAWRLQHIHHSAEKYAGTVEKTAGGQLNWTGKVNFSDRDLLKPLTWKKPAMVFVNSESDLFHESVPFEVIDQVYAVMGRCQHHTFQVLTKRPARMLEYYKSGPYQRILNAAYEYRLPKWLSLGAGIDNPNTPGAWGWKHVWLGVSVENQQAANERIPLLLQVPAAVRFLSCEPLLGPVDLSLYFNGANSYGVSPNGEEWGRLHWIITGGESGKDARPMHPVWVRSLRDQCQKAGTTFFFKQWGTWKPFVLGDSRKPDYGTFKNNPGDWNDEPVGTFLLDVLGLDWGTVMTKVGKKAAGRQLDGREWNEFPGQQKPVHEDPDLYTGGFDY